jgi:hypothetical protein
VSTLGISWQDIAVLAAITRNIYGGVASIAVSQYARACGDRIGQRYPSHVMIGLYDQPDSPKITTTEFAWDFFL